MTAPQPQETTMGQHTPGPWYEMSKGANAYQTEVTQEGTGKVICLTYTSNDADARLIAAAPTLLAALKAIQAEADYVATNGSDSARRGLPGIIWLKADAAIRHAEGAA